MELVEVEVLEQSEPMAVAVIPVQVESVLLRLFPVLLPIMAAVAEAVALALAPRRAQVEMVEAERGAMSV